MRRAIATVTGTIAVLVMLLSFKTEPRAARTRPAALAPASRAQSTAPVAGAGGTPPPATPSSAPAPAARSSSAQRPAAAASAPAAARPTPKPVAKTVVTGPAVQTNYGPVQVQVKLSGTKITDVEALQLPNDRRRSAAISNAAGPILRQEALAAQSAHIDTVSGATYTSDGYAQSLQSALDQAHVS